MVTVAERRLENPPNTKPGLSYSPLMVTTPFSWLKSNSYLSVLLTLIPTSERSQAVMFRSARSTSTTTRSPSATVKLRSMSWPLAAQEYPASATVTRQATTVLKVD